jgi:hypothetical protein
MMALLQGKNKSREATPGFFMRQMYQVKYFF